MNEASGKQQKGRARGAGGRAEPAWHERLIAAVKWALLLPAAIAVVVIAANAAGRRTVVIEAIEAPPGAAYSGEAFAARLRHSFGALLADTGGTEARNVLGADWLDNMSIQIPRTGISIGEINRLFRRWLGNDTRISGTIVRDGEGLRLSLQIGDLVRIVPAADEQPAASEDALVALAADRVYRFAEPYHYAVYLSSLPNRRDTAKALLASLALDRSSAGPVPSRDRAAALNALAAILIDYEGRCADALEYLDRARSLAPGLASVHGNLSNAHHCLGHDQEAADATARSIALMQGWVASSTLKRQILLENQNLLAGAHGRHRERLELLRQMEESGLAHQGLDRVQALVSLRDSRAAAGELRWYCTLARIRRMPCRERARYWATIADFAAMRGDWGRAAEFLAQAHRLYGDDSFTNAQLDAQSRPTEAIYLARGGLADAALAKVRPLPVVCYLCAISRGVVAAERRDWPASRAWFHYATRLAPRLPAAFESWAQMEFTRGAPGEALRLFNEALRHGADLPDALLGRARALERLGRHAASEQAYRRAARETPHWGMVHIGWADALWSLRRREEAQQRLRFAEALNLTAREREELEAVRRRWATAPASLT
jgi:tetratricopeptide (TPR) repeat protein